MELFRINLNCIDHYQAEPCYLDPPISFDNVFFQNRPKPRVPIIRVFGSTESGQRACAHIHGAFPYLYIEYQGGLSSSEG